MASVEERGSVIVGEPGTRKGRNPPFECGVPRHAGGLVSPEPSTGSGWLRTGHIRSIGTLIERGTVATVTSGRQPRTAIGSETRARSNTAGDMACIKRAARLKP